MGFTFSDDDIQRIADVLEVEPKREGNVVRFKLHDAESGRRLTLEVVAAVALPPTAANEQPANLVSVMAPSSFLQVQGCTGFIASQELGEVIFFARRAGVTNGLVVERQVGCSLFANFDQHLLTTDFTQLPPELIMGTVALSMTETLFNDLG